MKRKWEASALAGALMFSVSVSGPVHADVKAGVDAWQQGDYARAIAEWRPLAQAGDPDAQFNLGQAYKLGRGTPTDLTQALDWYRRAAAQGHERAEDNLGLVMFQQGDRANALPYLQRASSRGEPRAQYIVGTALFNGDLIGKDWVRAYALMTRAAASGLPQATASLTQMDKYIPEDQRKQGLAMASSLERQEKGAALASAPRTTPAPSGIRTTDIPPSTIQTPPAPVMRPQPVPPPVASRPQPAPPQVSVVNPRPAPAPVVAPPREPAPAPAPGRAASGNWRVQLGAFSEDARARALWTRLTARVGGLSGLQPYLVKGGNVTRLQAGPLASGAEAGRLCGAIKAAGADCIPKKM
ncbi:MAG: SPOR domain-containing protein [Sphingobium sp.]